MWCNITSIWKCIIVWIMSYSYFSNHVFFIFNLYFSYRALSKLNGLMVKTHYRMSQNTLTDRTLTETYDNRLLNRTWLLHGKFEI
jgi:hypothetical protein